MFDINQCYDLFDTEPNTAYFWSGLGKNGESIAADIANKNGGVTLEMLMDKHKDELINAGFEYDKELDRFMFSDENYSDWEKISSAFADQSSGNVHVVLGDNVREDSVWNTKELPALENNKNVEKVISVDPSTGEEKDVLLDKKSTEESSANNDKEKINKENLHKHSNPENSTRRGLKPSPNDNPPSNKGTSSKRGSKPSPTENVPQGKGIERGVKPSDSEISIKAANEASKFSSEQATQNIVIKPNGMGM